MFIRNSVVHKMYRIVNTIIPRLGFPFFRKKFLLMEMEMIRKNDLETGIPYRFPSIWKPKIDPEISYGSRSGNRSGISIWKPEIDPEISIWKSFRKSFRKFHMETGN